MRFLLLFLLLITGRSIAQTPSTINGSTAWQGTEHPMKTISEQQPVPYSSLKESSMIWTKRVWRKLDLKEKVNHVYYYPIKKMSDRESLFQALMRGIVEEGIIKAYEDEDFTIVKTKEQIRSELSKVDSVIVDDPDHPGQFKEVAVQNEFNLASITQFRIKEDWYFDRKKDRMDVRIVGVAAVQEVLASDGTKKGDRVLFWVYYPDARRILAKTEAFNRHNDAARISYDDMFIRRFFSSFIYKEIDADEKTINEYESGLDALLESEKIKEHILDYESTLWEFE